MLFGSPSIAAVSKQIQCAVIQCSTVLCFAILHILLFSFALRFNISPTQTNSNLFCLCIYLCVCLFEDVVASGVFLFSYRRTWQITKSIAERHLPRIIHASLWQKRILFVRRRRSERKETPLYAFNSVWHTCKRLGDMIHSYNFNIYLMKCFLFVHP